MISSKSREAWNSIKSTLRGRLQKPLRDVRQSGSSADYHVRTETDYFYAVERWRDLYRNDSIVGPAIDTLTNEVIQGGFTLDPQTGDQSKDQELKGRWEEWSNDRSQCEVQEEMTFHDVERSVLKSRIVDGDVLVILANNGKLQLVESHRIRTPRPLDTENTIVLGVELDAFRRRKAYYVTRDDIRPNDTVTRENARRISSRDSSGNRSALHIFDPKRISQTRGLSPLNSVVDIASIFDDLQFAQLVKAQMSAYHVMIRERDPDFVEGEDDLRTTIDGLNQSQRIQDISYGREIEGDPGESIKAWAPNIPNQEFFAHSKLLMSIMGINLGMPYVLLAMDASDTSFSSMRGALDTGRRQFTQFQKQQARKLNTEVYWWKLRQWIDEDPLLGEFQEIRGHRWNLPKWNYIQPVDDVRADLTEVRSGLNSLRRVVGRRGLEWEQVCQEIVSDNAIAIRKAKQEAANINQEFADDDPVGWRELFPQALPEGKQMALESTVSLNGTTFNEPEGDDSSAEDE